MIYPGYDIFNKQSVKTVPSNYEMVNLHAHRTKLESINTILFEYSFTLQVGNLFASTAQSFRNNSSMRSAPTNFSRHRKTGTELE